MSTESGMVLVPREPTEEILGAIECAIAQGIARQGSPARLIYEAVFVILTAAPASPAQTVAWIRWKDDEPNCSGGPYLEIDKDANLWELGRREDGYPIDKPLVLPREPTPEMLNAAQEVKRAKGQMLPAHKTLRNYYRAMLAAAPASPPTPAVDGEPDAYLIKLGANVIGTTRKAMPATPDYPTLQFIPLFRKEPK